VTIWNVFACNVLFDEEGAIRVSRFEKLYPPTPDHQMKINVCILPTTLSFDQLMPLRFRTFGILFSGPS
jgi:hypothetical protein